MLANSSQKSNQAEKNLKTLEDRATHSYGLLIKNKDGKKVIYNLVKSSDPIVFQKEHDKFAISEKSERITARIYENDSLEEYINLDGKARMILEKPIVFTKIKTKHTPISISISRDKDGLIKIHLMCDNERQSFDVNPPEVLINAETKANIEHSLSLMDI